MGRCFGFHGNGFLLRDLSNLKSVNPAKSKSLLHSDNRRFVKLDMITWKIYNILFFCIKTKNTITNTSKLCTVSKLSLTSQQTTQSALPPFSPLHPFFELFPVRNLAQQLVYGGCRHTLPPAGGFFAGQWICPKRVG